MKFPMRKDKIKFCYWQFFLPVYFSFVGNLGFRAPARTFKMTGFHLLDECRLTLPSGTPETVVGKRRGKPAESFFPQEGLRVDILL